MIGRTLYIGSSDGPKVIVVTAADGQVSLLTSVELQGNEALYTEEGSLFMTLQGASAPSVASLFESRNIQQVLEEDTTDYDFGWKPVELGWNIPFEGGFSSYGQFVSLNQNRKGVGIQGPTSIAGALGSPLTLLQKVEITNSFSQVNGWKSSSTPNSYALDPKDVQQEDSDYVYADAYVSWTDEGIITAPGVNGVGLQEYPANNTVEVET